MKFIVIGAGAVGTSLCSRLVRDEHDVVLIERQEGNVDKVASGLDLEILFGNGCSPELLMRAGIHSADYVIAVANVDEVNVTACLVAKLLNPAAKRIARIRDLNFEHHEIPEELLRATFDLIINPDQAAAEHLLRLFRVPGARELVDFCDGDLRVIALAVHETSRIIGQRLAELEEIDPNFPILIIAIVRGEKLIVPRGSDTIKTGDVLYFITVPERTNVLFEYCGQAIRHGRSAMIWGGGPLGRHLAHELEEQGTKIKMIVSDGECVEEIVDELKNTLVLSGDGKDQSLLLEENVSDIDAFFAVTPDEEDNILSSLLAKKLGAGTCMALVNRATYSPLISTIGVDVAVSARIAAASSIFRHIHSKSVVTEFSLRHLGAGFLEVSISPDAPISGKPLNELKIPDGIIIAAIVRNHEIVIPKGGDMLLADDHVVIFVVNTAHKKLEKLLGMKMEFFV